MSSNFGRQLHIQVFGESHGPAIGVVIDGLPAGEAIDFEELAVFLSRRAPGASHLVTPRQESDQPRFLSGIYQGKTTGSPLAAVIENKDNRSGDYAPFANTPRPSHADFTARIKYGGHADMRGGGHFSGRLTAPLCVAGGIALQVLKRKNIAIAAHLVQVGNIHCPSFDAFSVSTDDLDAVRHAPLSIVAEAKRQEVISTLETIRAEKDSIGAAIEVAAIGFPAGLGSPMFDGLENRLASAFFGIPGLRGCEFGSGFAAVNMRGSEHNDPFVCFAEGMRPASNRAGGILGGISTGLPLICRLAMKPTPSIGKTQKSVSWNEQKETDLTVGGRHDPCIGIRAVPVVEAVMALVLLDVLIEEGR